MTTISDLSVMLFPWGAEPPAVPKIVTAAKLAEDLGYYSVTLPTHMTMPPTWFFRSFPNREVLDAMVVLPAIAQATSTIRVGFNSALLPLLPPYAWAKYIATLDVMSGGRAIAGLAMGWWEEDFAAVGVERRRRGRMFDEGLEALKCLWTEERATFQGQHYRLADVPLEPKPVQKPYPSIWIGGGLKSVERAARYGDYILSFWPDEEAARQVWTPNLAAANRKWGRDAKLAAFTFAYAAENESDLERQLPKLREGVAFEDATIDPTAVTVSGSPERCAERIRSLRAAGVSHLVLEFQFHGLDNVDFGMRQMERFAREVVPLL
ncbi:MAG: LLM class flavin-dependent oxidoreductase [Gammaproteobacteria bacterium]|nr:LLM class flavin-dependent oxidoreductase [Gammaproteobacteria bacterium]NIR82931.1 LLM class flavin-dependent oxidoreductase [Gammaproteobacteria bacterium]NIR90200.1 LLM class flavin-dependent oxidoreductase [Gammaproteobacteria bacterium]NIU04077.1 LLM class flavin-dependent oxidoreductase [Gammaproteobacteria bacterium]NIV51066.1 TIGR03619 family F420-dependent LLM class oxidoreductase [Gammaproteobacteria bacterium]